MKKIISILLSSLMVFLIISLVAAATYQDYSGNYSGSFKVDPPVNTTIYVDDEGNIVNETTDNYIVFTVSNDKLYLSFETKNIYITSLYLKGGKNYRIYEWPDGTTSEQSLECPLNQGGNIPQISHYGFGDFILCKPTPTPTETTQETTKKTTQETTQEITKETSETTVTTIESTSSTTTINTTPTTTDEIPQTGEEGPGSVWIIGLTLLFLAAALTILQRKIEKNNA